METNQIIEYVYNKLESVIDKNKCLEARIIIRDLLNSFIYIDKIRKIPKSNMEALNLFLSSKKLEGCSFNTINYYKIILTNFISSIDKLYFNIITEDIRNYLSNVSTTNKISNLSIDNIRRVISSFFSFLETEDYIFKSPVKRIHKIKITKTVKSVYSEDNIELLIQSANCIRDKAIIEFLLSTGMRVGELVKINIDNINFENKECIVLGKGNKERKVYFDSKTKIDILKYLNLRNDNNHALFVSLLNPHNRLKVSGVEIMIRKLGLKIGIEKCHPHKFRRTLATKAIDKGMPIEQVQRLLGHSKIDTTLEYAMVNDNNVKLSHKKYLE